MNGTPPQPEPEVVGVRDTVDSPIRLRKIQCQAMGVVQLREVSPANREKSHLQQRPYEFGFAPESALILPAILRASCETAAPAPEISSSRNQRQEPPG